MPPTALDLPFRDHGRGPPLLLLHGLFGSGRNFDRIGKALGRRFRVLAPDLRNHGQAPRASSMAYPAMAADVARLIRREAPDGARVLGHSMGGKAAMVLALAEPGLVRRLIVADMAPASYRSGFLPFVRAMRAIDLAAVKRRGQADAVLKEAVPDSGIRAFLLQSLDVGEAGASWRLNLPVLEADMELISGFPEPPEGRTYDGPTLFLSGSRSDYVRPEHEAGIRALFPAAEIDSLADAGHFLHAEKPDAFVERVGRFLDGD